jgi:very-short-patch-repair endonuclease
MKYLPYNKNLRDRSQQLRNGSTLSEVLLWKYLRARQINGYQFNRQKPLGRFIADFHCKTLGLVIEIDGSSHIDKEQYDRDRDIKLQKLGVTVLHISDIAVKKDIRNVVARIVSWVDENG